jgi:hypothetical protein
VQNRPDSKARLIDISNQAREEIVRRLATSIHAKWDDATNTYASAGPELLDTVCVDAAVMREKFPGRNVEATRVLAEVRVGVNGKAIQVLIIRPHADERLDQFVRDSLLSKHYLPARQGGEFEVARMTVECRLEVR